MRVYMCVRCRIVQHQATGAAIVTKLSRTELNVLQTMIIVVGCFIVFWTPSEIYHLIPAVAVC